MSPHGGPPLLCVAMLMLFGLLMLAVDTLAGANVDGLHPRRQPCLFQTAWKPKHRQGFQKESVTRISLEELFTKYRSKGQTALNVPMPVVMTAPSGRQLVVCLNRKAGSTRWKHLFLKAAGWDPDPALHGEMNHVLYSTDAKEWDAVQLWENIGSAEDYADRVAKLDSLNSFIFVRSPYSRLLSGFLDKIAPARAAGCFGVKGLSFLSECKGAWNFLHAYTHYQFSPAAFEAFVHDLHRIHHEEGLEVVNNHIKPLSMQCGLNYGLQYDFIMKLEEEALWYPEWVTLLGMEDTVASGWAKYARTEDLEPERDCFYHPDWMSCAEMNNTVHAAGTGSECQNQDTSTRLSAGSNIESSTHHTGADALVVKYYTPQVAALVSEMFLQDLELLGYDVLTP